MRRRKFIDLLCGAVAELMVPMQRKQPLRRTV
jgi:hypothetical protein